MEISTLHFFARSFISSQTILTPARALLNYSLKRQGTIRFNFRSFVQFSRIHLNRIGRRTFSFFFPSSLF